MSEHEKPCRTCRQRKVRCSKTEPCTNCQRADIECQYDEPVVAPGPPKTTAALAEKVLQLEEMVQNLSRQLHFKTDQADTSSRPGAACDKVFIAERVIEEIKSHTPETLVTDSSNGRLVIENGSSRHLMNSFWATMYDEIGSLGFILREEQKTNRPHPFWLPNVSQQDGVLLPYLLPPSSSDFLVNAFLKKIDPFVKVIHKPTLTKQLNQFRRGVLPDAEDFAHQLTCIYHLALLSISPAECMQHLGQERDVLLVEYAGHVERSLAGLNITTTHKLTSLQTLLLHITYLVWTGEILQASSLLALALRLAQRLGVHKDGTNFNLSPWQVELRRRLWHHIVLIDTWCMENHGLEPVIPHGFSDVALPQNADDSAWDTSYSSNVRPRSQHGFTDMTLAIVQFENAALVRAILMNSTPSTGSEKAYFDFHAELRSRVWAQLESQYLHRLNPNVPREGVILDTAKLTFERMHLTALQPLLRHCASNPAMLRELEFRLFQSAVEFCNHVQDTRLKYIDHGLDWALIRAFCWHAVATMLCTVLRTHAISTTPEAQQARERIAKLFIDRPGIDYLTGNDSLWEPLERLKQELELRHLSDVVPLQQQQPWQGEALGLEGWMDEAVWETF